MLATAVSPQLKLHSVQQDDDTTHTSYKCKVRVDLAQDSIWDCRLKTVTITAITVSETDYGDGDTSVHIGVAHTGKRDSWRIYTDTGFEAAVSALLGTSVSFTEQGMQDDGYASME